MTFEFIAQAKRTKKITQQTARITPNPIWNPKSILPVISSGAFVEPIKAANKGQIR